MKRIAVLVILALILSGLLLLETSDASASATANKAERILTLHTLLENTGKLA